MKYGLRWSEAEASAFLLKTLTSKYPCLVLKVYGLRRIYNLLLSLEMVLPPIPASGGAAIRKGAKLVIRLSRQGCTNRPFYHLQLSDILYEQHDQCIEQLGTYDPLPNERNEKLVSCNFQRIRYWLGEGAIVSQGAKIMLGLAGFFPIHPRTYMQAWKNRMAAELPEPPMPKKLTWRERKKILMQQAEEALNAPKVEDELEEEEKKAETA